MTWAAHWMSRWLVASIVAVIPVAAHSAEDSEPEERLVQSVQHGVYTFNVHRTEHSAMFVDSRLEVLKNGVVLPFSDWVDWDDSPMEDNEIWVFKRAQDVTGNGTLDVIIESSGGGNRWYYGYDIFELGSDLRHVGSFYTGYVQAQFIDLDGRPGLEVQVRDDVFYYYWKGDVGVFRPPIVVMRFKDGRYRVAPDLMRRPEPVKEELAAFAREVRDSPIWREEHRPIPKKFTHVMWKLIYAGYADEAIWYFHLAWPGWREGKDEFYREFYQCQLRASRYWPAIAAMNGLPAEKPIGDCPGLDY